MQTAQGVISNIGGSSKALEALLAVLSSDDRVMALCWGPLPPEYSYASLSSMLLDAIFSIGVRYGQVRAVVTRHAALSQYDPWCHTASDPCPLLSLIRDGRAGTADDFANKLSNHCRTSTRSGILKAEAVILAAEALVRNGITDLASWRAGDKVVMSVAEYGFRAVKGQGSGVSWDYLSMLAGDDGKVKPDRMVVWYVEAAVGRRGILPTKAGELLRDAAVAIRGKNGYPSSLTARHLDWAVWNVARTWS